MRLFIALPVSEEVREAVAQVVRELRLARADVKWVETYNLHMTIKFLGEVAEEEIGRLRSELADAAADIKAPKFTIGKPGFFPNKSHPRVLWLGLNGDVSLADELGRRVDLALGFKEEKRSWHITLGRFRSERNMEGLLALIPEVLRSIQGLGWTCEHYSLLESRLTPKGPVYTELERYSLQKG